MAIPVKPVPDGYHVVNPLLVVNDAARAIEFYTVVFGATERSRLVGPGGKIAHAELSIGDSVIMLADEFPDWGDVGPKSYGHSPVRLILYVRDVDALASRAVGFGAKMLLAVADQFYGDRSGRLEDPFGHLWIISTHKEDVSPEEMHRRMEALSKRT